MIQLLLLALALSMDAFAVAIGLGAKHRQQTLRLALLAGIYFGIAQGVMPLLGYLLGKSVLGFVAGFAPWLAFFILLGLGGKMIYEAVSGDLKDTSPLLDRDVPHSLALDIANNPKTIVSQRTMLTLAFATSIDAMAAGFTLNVLAVDAYAACLVIAVVTTIVSFIGVFLGRQSGTYLESKAEIFGGVVLIAIGFKMLFF